MRRDRNGRSRAGRSERIPRSKNLGITLSERTLGWRETPPEIAEAQREALRRIAQVVARRALAEVRQGTCDIPDEPVSYKR